MEQPQNTQSPAENMQALHPAIKVVWGIQYAIPLVFILIGGLLAEGLLFDLVTPFGVLTGAVVLGLGLLARLAIQIRYRIWRYVLREEELYLQRGLLTRVYTVVPLRRIQHLDVSRGIFERFLDLGRLVIYTAGTQGNAVELPGLLVRDAERLRDEVRQYIIEDAL